MMLLQSARELLPPRSVDGAMVALKRQLRGWGWEVRRTDQDRSLGEHLRSMMPYLGVNCVLDVGAGTGDYGAFLRDNGYDGPIISFEPVEASFQILARRSARDPRWQAYRYALGSQATTRPIHVTRNPRYASFLLPSMHTLATFPGGTVERAEVVEVRRLDQIFEDIAGQMSGPHVFLRVSTCGWDLEVLRGAENLQIPILAVQSELSLDPPHDGAIDLSGGILEFGRAGFAISGMFARPHQHGFRLSELDCVMVPLSDPPAPLTRRW
jgi:FkbM family methyltransferase